jgi:multiple sugar transport system substrate-binding protein
MPWLLTNGGSSLSDDWKTATLNTPQAIESATFMRTMVEKKWSPDPGSGTFDPLAQSNDGKLAMFGGGRWPVIGVRKLGFVDKTKIVPWPQKAGLGSPVGWNAYPIMKGTKNKEAAWAFVKFITSKEASEYFATQGGTIVPPRKSVAESDAFLSNAPAGSEKLYAALDYATPIPSPDKGNLVQADIEAAYLDIMNGNVSPEEGLNELNEKVQANL